MKLRNLLDQMQSISNKIGSSQPMICGGTPRDQYMERLDHIADLDITTGDKTVQFLAQEFGNVLAKQYDVTTKIHDDGHGTIYLGDFKIDFSSNFNIPNIENILIKQGITKPTSMQKEMFSRDFTCNSLLLSLDLKNVIDPTYHGLQDIDQKMIRTCLSPEITLLTNKNRVVRAIYLASKLDFNIDPNIISYVAAHPESVKISTPKSLTEKLNSAFEFNPERAAFYLTQMNLWNYVPITPVMRPFFMKKNTTVSYILSKYAAISSVSEAKQLFGLLGNFTEEDVKKKYKELVVKNHPDVNPINGHEKMLDITQAKEILINSLTNPEPEPLLDEEEPWRHSYHTPVSKYTDDEKWEYYTNPEIFKQYQKDFEAEQYYHQYDDDSSRLREQEEEDRIYNLKDNIISILEKVHPNKLVEDFGVDLDAASIKELGLGNLASNQDGKELSSLISAAIIEIIYYDHPEYLIKLLELDYFKNVFNLNNYTKKQMSDLINKIDSENINKLFVNSKLSLKDLSSYQDEQVIIDILLNNQNKVVTDLLQAKNPLDMVGWFSAPVLKNVSYILLDQEQTKPIVKLLDLVKRELNQKIKTAYFQGGGGVNEPTPKKRKYKIDPAEVVQPRFEEPFYRNYDLYNVPGKYGPGTRKNPKNLKDKYKAKKTARTKVLSNLFKVAVDFPSDNQVNPELITGQQNNLMESLNPAGGYLDKYLPDNDLEDKDPTKLNFGRDYTEQPTGSKIDNIEKLLEQYLPTDLYGLPDGVDVTEEELDQPNDINPFYGTLGPNSLIHQRY